MGEGVTAGHGRIEEIYSKEERMMGWTDTENEKNLYKRTVIRRDGEKGVYSTELKKDIKTGEEDGMEE